jgi:citrate synthase
MQQEQKYHAVEQKNFALFVECAKAATAQGLNVAPNRANFEMVREAIDDQAQDFNVENVMAMLFRGGLPLAPNAMEIAKQLMQQREDAERDRLADIVVDAMRSWRVQTNTGAVLRDEYGRSQALNKLKYLPLEELRSRVEVIEHNRALAAKSLEELKAQTEQDRQQRHQARVAASGKPPLPEFNTVTNERMDKVYLLRLANINPTKYRDLVLRHGSHAITLRLNGQG